MLSLSRYLSLIGIGYHGGADEYFFFGFHLLSPPGFSIFSSLRLPGGRVDAHDPDLVAAAVRETEEEAGVRVDPVGILKIQYRHAKSDRADVVNVRMRIIFLAVPMGAGSCFHEMNADVTMGGGGGSSTPATPGGPAALDRTLDSRDGMEVDEDDPSTEEESVSGETEKKEKGRIKRSEKAKSLGGKGESRGRRHLVLAPK